MGYAEVIAGRFVVEGEAASGGMGTVYRAHDRVGNAAVALKIVRLRSAIQIERFEREAALLAALVHPGIVRYVAHGSTPGGDRYLAMEWLDGEDLAARLARRVLPAGEGLSLVRRAADALAFAHARGIVHRDIKPGNLFLPGGDAARVKLVDFGIARPSAEAGRVTVTGGVLGTPGYMAPEQLEGRAAPDPRSDVFSLGCVLFECLTGQPAFAGASPMAALGDLLLREPPRLRDVRADVPAALDELVARMLSRRPAERPRDGAEVAAELDRVAALCGAWTAPPDAPTLSGSAPPGPPALPDGAGSQARGAASRERVALTLGEQRLVSLIFVGEAERGAAPRSSPRAAARAAEPAGEAPREPPPSAPGSRPPASSARAAEIRALVELHGGRLSQLAPGAQLVMIAGAGSAVDRAERAAQCALALRAELPGAALCVITGRGVLAAGLVEGDVIDRGVAELRAALAERAERAERAVRLDRATADMLGPRFVVARAGRPARGARDDEGPRAPDEALVLTGERAVDEVAPALLGKTTPCVGRARELSMLHGVLSGCISDSLASAVLVLGPPGAGKSRLRQELFAALRRQGEPVEILWGRADSGSAGSPFGMIADVLCRAAGLRARDPTRARHRKLKQRLGRHLGGPELDRAAAFLGEIAGAPSPEHARLLRAARQSAAGMSDGVRAAWEDWLAAECAARPVLVALEDLHWGDAATVRLLDATLRNLRELPLMLLALARPDVHRQFPSLWAEREVQTIKLGPLPRRASAELVRAALGAAVPEGVVTQLVERAGGNPFYLEELIRAVASGNGELLPDSVLGTVEARLDAEGNEGKRVLRAASIFGDRFSKRGVAALLGGEERLADVEAWLSALAERELVAPIGPSAGLGDGADHVFRHALVREAAYAMLTERDRALGHRLAGAWLERSASADPRVVAEHFRRGGEPDRAVRWYRRAAERSLEANDLRAAIERAACGEACGAAGEDLGALRLVAAEANIWEGDLAAAEQLGASAAELLPAGSPGWFRAVTQVAAAAGKLGAVDRVARWAAVAESLAAARSAGEGDGAAAPPASGIATLPSSAFAAPPSSAFAAPPSSAFAAPPSSAFAAPPSSAFAAPPSSAFAAPPSSAFAAPPSSAFAAPPSSAFATPPSSAAGLRRARIACLCECGAQLVFGGRHAEADALLARIDEDLRAPPPPDAELVAMAQQLRAIRASAGGDPVACLDGLEASLAAFEQAGDRRSACVIGSNLGFIYAELGELGSAESVLRAALEAADRLGLRELATVAMHNLGHVLGQLGKLDEAQRVERRAVEAFQQRGDLRMEGVARTYLAKIALLSGDAATAEREALAAEAALHVAPRLRAPAVAVRARALLAAGQVAAALGAARAAYGELAELGSLEEGESLVRLAYAEALAASGAHGEAAAVLAEARERLLARAERIADPRRRERFLASVPENARIVRGALATDDGGAQTGEGSPPQAAQAS
ncbi:serine/threonine-protein kinase [Sorangium sp. So ce854]|uniref:serine/threonine-protein kinase n=1 Tax=Sorangium sp. So ce854 TaxID=3133322 RepID=UPI003F5FADB2